MYIESVIFSVLSGWKSHFHGGVDICLVTSILI
jgi:hypothetical protein